MAVPSERLVDIAGATNVYADIDAPSKTISLEMLPSGIRLCSGTVGADNRREPRWRLASRAWGKVLMVDPGSLTSFGAVGRGCIVARKLLHPGSALTRFRAGTGLDARV